MTTVWIYVDTNKEVGDVDHLKISSSLPLRHAVESLRFFPRDSDVILTRCSCAVLSSFAASRPLSLEGQRRLNLCPVDDLENHSAPVHLRFEIRGMYLPFGRLPKPGFLAQLAQRIVSRERSTDALIHHGEAVVRERLIIHQVPAGKEPPLGRFSRGS
jgi:hypothetical protein